MCIRDRGKVATGNVDAGEEATVRINVERAAAKLMEQSQTSAFTAVSYTHLPPPNVPTQRICCLSSQNRLVILFSILEWNAFSFR